MTRRPAGTTTSTPPSSNAGGLVLERPRPRHSRGARPRDTFPSRRPRMSDCCSSGTRARGAADFQRGRRRAARRAGTRAPDGRDVEALGESVRKFSPALGRARRSRLSSEPWHSAWRRRDDDARFSTRVAARARGATPERAGVASRRARGAGRGFARPNAREGVSRRGEWGFGSSRARRRPRRARGGRRRAARLALVDHHDRGVRVRDPRARFPVPPPRRARRGRRPVRFGRGRARRGPRARPTHGRARRRRLPRPLPRGPDQGGRPPHVHRRRPRRTRARRPRARRPPRLHLGFVLVVVRIRPGFRPVVRRRREAKKPTRATRRRSRRRGRARRLAHGKTERRRGRRRRTSRVVDDVLRGVFRSRVDVRPRRPRRRERSVHTRRGRGVGRRVGRRLFDPLLLFSFHRLVRVVSRRISRRTSLGGGDDDASSLRRLRRDFLARRVDVEGRRGVPRARGARRRLRRRTVGGGDGRFDRSELRRRDPK